jgi:hypothetical protein
LRQGSHGRNRRLVRSLLAYFKVKVGGSGKKKWSDSVYILKIQTRNEEKKRLPSWLDQLLQGKMGAK